RIGPAAEASGSSFGWVNASFGNPEPYFRLRFQSLLEYRRLESETEGGIGVKWGGSLLWEADAAALACYLAEHGAWGYGLRLVDREAFRALEPKVSEPPELAVFAELEGSLDASRATRALLTSAERHGAETRYACELLDIRHRNGRIAGADTSGGPIEADCVVLAAGVATEALAGRLGFALPMANLPGLLIRTRPTEPLLGRLVLSPGCHVKQDPDGALVAGADFGGGGPAEDPETAGEELLGQVRALLPGASGLVLEDVVLGLRPIPADGFPAVGFAPGLEGLYVAVMHSGVTLAPAIGRFAAEEIFDGMRIDLLAPYRPSRFATA
ncbi:MAG: FAD-dependent oxidoreductase, partial [Kiloniellales bacterium]|nr:FAD-dependent oxidoreductase [Kiloniellales bacterium]